MSEHEDIQDEDTYDDLAFADEDKLRHEIKYLRERLTNLEGFKRMFFALKAEREKQVIDENDSEEKISTEGVVDLKDSGADVNEVDHLQDELKKATEMAMLFMTTAGEYGPVLDFFKKISTVENYQQVADLVLETASNYDLNSSIQIRCVEGELDFCSDESKKDVCADFIFRFKDKGRLVEENSLVCINFENISFLSADFPVDDADKCGRLKDYLVTLCSGVDERVKSLDTRAILEKQTQTLLENQKKSSHKIVKATHEAITVIEEGIENQILQVNAVYGVLEKELCQSFSDIGLSDQFKETLLEVLKGNKNKLNAVLTQSLALDQQFVEIITKLEKAYGASEEQGKESVSTLSD